MSIVLLYKKNYEEVKRHLMVILKAYETLKSNNLFPLDSQRVETILEDEALLSILDQIAYRYSKLQDSLAKLIRSYLYMKGENVENLTIIDVLNKAEKFDLGITKDKWLELRELRNMLVHEYESEKSKIAYALNKIYPELKTFETLLERLYIG